MNFRCHSYPLYIIGPSMLNDSSIDDEYFALLFFKFKYVTF